MSFNPIICYIFDGHERCFIFFLIINLLCSLDEKMTLLSLTSLKELSVNCNIGIIIPGTEDFKKLKQLFLERAPKLKYNFVMGEKQFKNWNNTQVYNEKLNVIHAHYLHIYFYFFVHLV